jgi:protein involved in polysaccharide export with SLBB domain
VVLAVAQDEPPTVIVRGAVSHPGAYPANTVSTAIVRAGGLAAFADSVAFIYHTENQSAEQAIPVPIKDILKGKKPDIALQPGEILNVQSRPLPIFREKQQQKTLPDPIDPPGATPNSSKPS